MRNWLLPIFLSLAAAAAQAALPQRVEIAYDVLRNGTAIAEVVERLEHDGRRYRLHQTWKGKGVYALRGEATRDSRGTVARDGLRPTEFEELRTGRNPRRASFGTDGDTLKNQDRLSLAWTFAIAPPRAPVTVQVADGDDVSTHVYEVAGRERVVTAAGEFDAVKLVRRKDKPDSRTVELWLAADRQFLPVRVQVTDRDGTRIDQVAARITLP